VKGKIVPVLNQAPCHEDVLGSRGIAPCILILGTRQRWAVSFMSWLLYLWGKSSRYLLVRRLVGPQS